MRLVRLSCMEHDVSYGSFTLKEDLGSSVRCNMQGYPVTLALRGSSHAAAAVSRGCRREKKCLPAAKWREGRMRPTLLPESTETPRPLLVHYNN